MRCRRRIALLIAVCAAGPAIASPSGMVDPNAIVIAQASEDAGSAPEAAQAGFNRAEMTSNTAPESRGPRETVRVPASGEGALFSTVAGVDARGNTFYYTYRTPFELFLSLAVIVTFVAFAVLYCMFINKAKRPSEFNRVFISMVATSAALLLVVAGFDEKQTAPVFGLLGAMLGYIFGRSDPIVSPGGGAGGSPQSRDQAGAVQ